MKSGAVRRIHRRRRPQRTANIGGAREGEEREGYFWLFRKALGRGENTERKMQSVGVCLREVSQQNSGAGDWREVLPTGSKAAKSMVQSFGEELLDEHFSDHGDEESVERRQVCAKKGGVFKRG